VSAALGDCWELRHPIFTRCVLALDAAVARSTVVFTVSIYGPGPFAWRFGNDGSSIEGRSAPSLGVRGPACDRGVRWRGRVSLTARGCALALASRRCGGLRHSGGLSTGSSAQWLSHGRLHWLQVYLGHGRPRSPVPVYQALFRREPAAPGAHFREERGNRGNLRSALARVCLLGNGGQSSGSPASAHPAEGLLRECGSARVPFWGSRSDGARLR
jgi:hypothetical protein